MGKSKKKNNSHATATTSPSVKVVTAGGAGSPNRKGQHNKDPRRNKPKQQQRVEDDRNDDNIISRNDVASTTTAKGLQSDTSPPSHASNTTSGYGLEFEASEAGQEDVPLRAADRRQLVGRGGGDSDSGESFRNGASSESEPITPIKVTDLYQEPAQSSKANDLIWLFLCFIGIMASFVCYGLLLEYTTSGGRKLHELSFLFVTSGLYTLTAAAGRYVRGEQHTTIPPSRFAILGLTSMGSTFTSVRSLR